MKTIELATVLRGASEFKQNNVNVTFRGQVLTSSDQTRQAIIKDLDLIQLCNELFAHSLAREFGLPIPDSYLGLVRPGVLSVSKAPKTKDGSHLVFVSVDMKVPNVTYRLAGIDTKGRKILLDHISNWIDLGKLYAFDAWIANVDRHHGNLLFGGNNEFWLIDHGHCFTGPNWQANQLIPDVYYSNLLSQWVTKHLTLEQKKRHVSKVNKFGSDIESFDASKSLKNSRINELLPVQCVSALKVFLNERIAKVPDHAMKALGLPRLI